VELPARAYFADPTVAALARAVEEARVPGGAAEAAEAVGADASPHRLLAVIDDLSDEELDRLIAGHSPKNPGSSE